jgi:hypothetical protein
MKGSGEYQSRSVFVDWTTRRWVQATGRRVALDECSWLEGPVGDGDVIGADFFAPLSDIPEISFFCEGAPDREPGDLVAGLFDGTLDLLLLGLPSFE